MSSGERELNQNAFYCHSFKISVSTLYTVKHILPVFVKEARIKLQINQHFNLANENFKTYEKIFELHINKTMSNMIFI